MSDWQEKLASFLEFNDRVVLPNAGSVSKKDADAFAKNEYEQFADLRRLAAETQGCQETIQALENLSRKGVNSKAP